MLSFADEPICSDSSAVVAPVSTVNQPTEAAITANSLQAKPAAAFVAAGVEAVEAKVLLLLVM